MYKNALRTVVLATLLAATASVASAANTGSCQATSNQQRQNCTVLSSSCAAGYLPNPGAYPNCNCVCQASNASKAPAKEDKPSKPKS